MKSQLQSVLPLLFSLLICGAAQLLTPGVSGNRESDSLDRPCPGEMLVYTCSQADTFLSWTINNGTTLHTYIAGVSSSFTTVVDSVTGARAEAMEVGVGVPLTSTLTIDATGNDGVLIQCIDSGADAEALNATLDLADPLMPPEYDCTLTGQRTLRLEWIDNNMNADDALDEYRACSCIGGGCSCVPTTCGDLNNNVCVREFEADQVHNFMFTAVNCGSQESTASTLTVDAQADPPIINEVCAWYNQSTGELCNIAVNWNTVAPISVPVGCVEGIAQQYNVRCGDNFQRLDLLQSTICNGSMCPFESPASTGCTLSVDSVSVMGTRTTNQDIPGTTPLTVTVSNGRITCNMVCNVCYGIDPNFVMLPNINTSGPAGVELTQLVAGEENFYVVSADIGSMTVKVKGSLRTECDCSNLVTGSSTCQDSGALSILNGMVTYESVSIESVATYQCNDGFSLSGVGTRTCQGDGSWSGAQPTCEEEDSSSFPLWVIAIIVVLIIILIAIGVIIGYLIRHLWDNGSPTWLIVVIIFLCFAFVGIGIALYLLIRKYCCRDEEKPKERLPLRERTTSADGGDVEVAEVEVNTATYADPGAIDRQEFPGTQDVYTVVDKTKKVHKPEDHMPTYQTPEEIKREAAPATGQMYTVPEAKKGSKKKKEAPPPTKSEEELQQMYSQVDMGKKHQPPSGLVYSDISLPPAGKVPPSKSVNYTDVQPHH